MPRCRKPARRTPGARGTWLMAASILVATWPIPLEAEGNVTYLTDLSRCVPRSALSSHVRKDTWQLIPYETCEPESLSGTMIGAASFVEAPDVKLPLAASGWHAVYVGFWNPHYAYDDGTTVKVRLTDDPCFTRIQEPEPPLDWNATHIKEALFKVADLAGRDLVLGKLGGPFAQKAYVAYVKLVPLSAEEVSALQADRSRTDTRTLEATIDGISYFWSNEYRTKRHILELVERYRHSDVGKVIWAVNYGDLTNYPTQVGVFWAADRDVPIGNAPGNNSYIAGERAAYNGLRRLVARGIIPETVAAQHVHAMGLRFDAMFRLAILGSVPPMRGGPKGFVETHPEFRQVMQNGTPAEKASYAFPEVRELMVAIIREVAETFDIDGASLGFVRGPEFMSYEQPVLDDFRREYGEDGRGLAFGDPRMRRIRCRYLNDFVRDARRSLDEIGAQKGKRLELSAWIVGGVDRNLDHGMDVERWIRQGWLDSVINHGGPLDPQLIATAKACHCRFIFNAIGGEYAKQWMTGYGAGVDGFAIWDIDSAQDSPTLWPILSRAGHRDEIEAFITTPPTLTTVRLATVGGFDVLQGLGAAVYSGG